MVEKSGMSVLIVGAGMAGLTLSAKLRQQGREPVLIERLPSFADAGYDVSLRALGNCLLHGVFSDAGWTAEPICRGPRRSDPE